MNRIGYEFRYHAGGAAALILALVLGCPSLGLAQAGATQTPATTPPAPTTTKADHVQARINELHTKLKITAEQEEQWTKVTEVMRENAGRIDEASKRRAEKAQTMTAVEDLKAYGEITEVHAEGTKRFVAAFEPLYNSMSDAQKQDADNIFLRRTAGRARPASKSAQPPSKTN